MLSAIRKRFSSLTWRFLGVYLLSLVVILATFVWLITAINTQQAYNAINRTLEVGPGYLDGFSADNTLAPPNSYYTGERVITEFVPFGDRSANGVSVDGVLFKYLMTAPDVMATTTTNSDQISLYRSDFPRTFELGFTNMNAYRIFYYYPVPGFDNVVLVASVDGQTVQTLEAADRTLTQAVYLLPVLLILAAVFGQFVARKAVAPVLTIARATESMSEKNLSERVWRVSSSDEIGRLAHSFNRMADRLEQAFTAQKLFISDAAHELRTPLASMKTAVTYALSRPDIAPEHQQLLIGLSTRVETMEHLVNELLLQARVDENRTLAAGIPVSVAVIVTEAADIFQPLFEENGITFTLDTPDKASTVRGDGKQLFRLISNLLDNAAKNTPAGREVTLELTAEEGEAVIRVRDTGRGIAPEHLNRIFDRFYKVSAERSPESGFGLGLSICRGIAARHGGSIAVESEPGRGTVFTVRLPLAKG
ncbi:MAG: HAMP domain-containing sensor histidine kinase [Dehalogenimonas sp.]|uniref:histidine kinase n=1 Tax=Candidatus Dehalogenimonas loeffleri TaxID=3127115 RepID=A0ABZ2JC77_9CHLR|nr:HAMP domain-containing sensor histidine kinase [Dehalogenimonas sp.]